MADFLGLERGAFLVRYCRSVGSAISLLEYENGDCVFYRPEGCAVYPVRPVQCRAFPFWPHLLASQGAWEAEKGRCRGMGKGKKYSCSQIEAMRDSVGE